MRICARCKGQTIRGILCPLCSALKIEKYNNQCLGGCGKTIQPHYMQCQDCEHAKRMNPEEAMRLAGKAKQAETGVRMTPAMERMTEQYQKAMRGQRKAQGRGESDD